MLPPEVNPTLEVGADLLEDEEPKEELDWDWAEFFDLAANLGPAYDSIHCLKLSGNSPKTPSQAKFEFLKISAVYGGTKNLFKT